MNSKGADQSAQMRRLIGAFVVRKPPKTGFLAPRPNYSTTYLFYKQEDIGIETDEDYSVKPPDI